VLALVLHASPCRHRPEKGALARNRTALQGVLGASGERVTAGPETLPSAQGSAGHAGELGQRRPGLLAAADTGGTVEPATREIGSGDRRGRSNRDRRHPLHFSQRLQALSAEWTPALYLAVPFQGRSLAPLRLRDANFWVPGYAWRTEIRQLRADSNRSSMRPGNTPPPPKHERNAIPVGPTTPGGSDLGSCRRAGRGMRASRREHRPLSGAS